MRKIYATDGVNSLLQNDKVKLIGRIGAQNITIHRDGTTNTSVKVEFDFDTPTIDTFIFENDHLVGNSISAENREPYVMKAYWDCIVGHVDTNAFINIVVTEYLRYKMGFAEYALKK